MFLARVVSDVVATHRHHNLGGRRLLLVQRLDLDDVEEGTETSGRPIGTSRGVAMAERVDPGPLPLREPLAPVHAHSDRCVACSVPAPAPSASSRGQTY